MTFPNYAELNKAGAIKSADTVGGMARHTGIDEEALAPTVSAVSAMQKGTQACPF
jgi:hypothetical protein